MSLLMDALKKAEQEKKDAARRLVSGEEELSVTRREAIAESTDAHPVTGAAENAAPAPTAESTPDKQADKTYHTSAMDLALEPLETAAHNPLIPKRPPEIIAIEDMPQTADPDITQDVLSHKLSLQPEFDQANVVPVPDTDKTRQVSVSPTETRTPELDPDKTFHGVSLDQSIVAGLYEDTIQGEPFKPGDTPSYDETLPGVPAAQLARDIGTQDQPTPVAAQTLFTATGTVTRPSSGFRWLLISLCVLAVSSAVIFYYYSVTPVSRNIPSPLVAKGVETIISSQDIQTVTGNIVPAPINDNVSIEPAPAEPAAAAASVPEPPIAVTEATAATVADITEVTTEATPAASTSVNAVAPVIETATTEPAGLPAIIEPPASLIKISRSPDTAAEEGRIINEAFNAWQQGNYELARSRYQQAYEQSPDNRDVLLGLAAVATKTGDPTRAVQIYTRLVALNPLDNVARAALFSLQSGEDTSSSISSIKSMLADSPEQPSLYFTLGKLYAGQSNWSAAQQAFFDAYRLDSANPDYAFNLAVSLDRLDQTGTALDYYTVALGLSESTPAGFDPAAVADRIRTLEAGK